MNERQPNSSVHEDRSGWQRRKTRLQWLMWLSAQRIGKDIRVSSYFFTRRAADVVSEACFIAMTGDRHDDRSRSVTVMSRMNFNSCASFTIPVLFLKTKLNILYECELCLIFVCPFCFLFEDFRLCSRFSKVNHGAWHVYKPRFGSSVATCRLACSEISLSIIEKKTSEKSRKGRTYYNLADGVTASAQLHTLYSPRARSFNQFQHALYPNFIIIMCNVPKLFNLQDNYLTRNLL